MVADIPVMRMKFRVGFFIGFVVMVAVLILAVTVTMPVMLFPFFRLRRLDFSRLQFASCGSGRNEQSGASLKALSRFDYRLSVCIGGGRMLETDDIRPRRFEFHLQPFSLDDEVELADPVFVGIVMAVGGKSRRRSAGKHQRTENSGSRLSEMRKVAVHLETVSNVGNLVFMNDVIT